MSKYLTSSGGCFKIKKMKKILIIAKTTFRETIRQPVFMIILAAGCFMISMSPSYAMFTLMEDIKMVKDMSLATMLLAGLLQAVFASVRVVSQEIENKTVFTLLTKPVSKSCLLAGKFLGLGFALLLSMYMLNIFIVMAVRVGVPEAEYSPIHRTLIYGQVAALVAAIVLAAFSNYFQDRPFAASLFLYSFITFTVTFAVFGFFDKGMSFQPFLSDLNPEIFKAGYLVFVAVVVISAAAVAFATRFGSVFTIGLCLALFIIGLLSDHIFGRFAPASLLASAAYAAVPNMQVFWVADAVTEGVKIPAAYLLRVSAYGIIFSIAAVLFGVLIFEQKESS